VAQLTGHRFLGNYSSDEQQYMALMSNAATFARAHNLRPGIALSDAQMAQLTSDIVWLVEQDVRLPDGTVTRALVPQVYVRVRDGDLHNGGTLGGTLIAGNDIELNLGGDLTHSGSLQARRTVVVHADNLHNLGGRIQGQQVGLYARSDIHITGGSVSAANALELRAGRDVTLTTTTQSDAKSIGASQFSRTHVDRVAGLYVSGTSGHAGLPG
jgi:filamentous hemagglutinin